MHQFYHADGKPFVNMGCELFYVGWANLPKPRGAGDVWKVQLMTEKDMELSDADTTDISAMVIPYITFHAVRVKNWMTYDSGDLQWVLKDRDEVKTYLASEKIRERFRNMVNSLCGM